MKILINRWFKARVSVSLIVYTKWMLIVYTNWSEVRKHNQWFWRKGQRFEIVIRVGRLQFTYTDYSIGGELDAEAKEKAEQAEWQNIVG